MAFTLTKKDKEVIDLFLKGKDGESKKLTSENNRLDGGWLGGSNLAYRREDGSISVRNITSKADETIQNYIKKRGIIKNGN